MRKLVQSSIGIVLLAGLPASGPSATTAPVAGEPVFVVDTLADGVHLFRPADGRTGRANSLVVERDDGVLVVDAQPSETAARELLAAIAPVTSGPVRYVVFSHPHPEAVGGAAAFPDSALRVASVGCRQALADEGWDWAAELGEGRGSDPVPSRPQPVLVVNAMTELDDPRNPVRLVPIPHAHTRGDLLVALEDGIVAVGHLVAPDRAPWAGDASMKGWVFALNDIAQTSPETIVPLRGPALDHRQLRLQRDTLAWVLAQVQLQFGDAVPTEQMTDRVLASEHLSSQFETGAPPERVRLLVDATLREILADRRRRGLVD